MHQGRGAAKFCAGSLRLDDGCSLDPSASYDSVLTTHAGFAGHSTNATTKTCTRDVRAFSAYPVHSNWDFEPDAWVALRDRSERGFAAQIISVATRFKLEFDLSLLHKKT